MKKTGTISKLLRAVVIFSIVAVMMAVYLPYNTVDSGAAKITEADIQSAKDKLTANEKKIKEYQAKIDALEGSISDAIEMKNQLDQQISYIQTNIEDTEELIEKYSGLIAEKETQISDKQSKLSVKYEDFLERLRISYEDGSQNYLEILISSQNLIDFITRVDNLGSVLSYEQTLMDELDRESEDLKAMKASLAQKKEEYEELSATQVKSQKELKDKLAQSTALIAKLEKDQTAAEKAKAAEIAANTKLDKELENILKEYDKQQKEYAGGALLWPVETNYKKISSKYGWRVLFGVREFHLGVDIPAAYGTNIFSSNDGTVVKATYSSSYGYYVLIDHGGGKSTLYAHCSKLLVKEKQTVKRGEIIAKIGSTGNSTGYHLHYEVRINGATTNPLVAGMLVIESNGKFVDPVAKNLLTYSG